MPRTVTLSLAQLVTVSLLLLLPVAALRADKTEDAYIALAVARAKAELAIKNAQAAVDEPRSGWSGAWQLSEVLRNKTYTALEGRLQSEERKPDEARDHNLIEQIQKRLAKLRDDWEIYNAKDRESLNRSYQEAAETVNYLAQALEALANTERAWKAANLDSATLQPAYDGLAKRAAEMKDQADKALNAAKARQKTIQSDFDETNTFLGKLGKETTELWR